MKPITPICLALVSACSMSPERRSPSSSESVSASAGFVVDFQTGFRDTELEFEVDHATVFSGRLTTDARVGLARSIQLPPCEGGRVEARITVDQATRYSFELRMDRGRYIGFAKDLDRGTLEMEQSHQPFEYD